VQVSLLDDLNAGLHAAQRALGALGPRPNGDPGALLTLAGVVRQEADDAAGLGRLEASIPGSMVFAGPAASRFRANADDVAKSLVAAQRMLDEAADAIERKARDLAQAQADYDRRHHGLLGQIEDIAGKMPIVP
jgi:hypothetical protein